MTRTGTPALRDLLQQLGVLGSTGFQRQINARLARVALAQVAREFAESRGPDDRPWAPLRARTGPPLRFSGRLAGSFGSSMNGPGFTLVSSLLYAGVHQEGATIRAKRGALLRFRAGGGWVSKAEVTIPARPILPGDELGPTWSSALNEELEAALNELMR